MSASSPPSSFVRGGSSGSRYAATITVTLSRPPPVERPLDESFARIARPGGLQQDTGDRPVVHEVRQAIAAEQQAIAVLELQPVGVHLDILAGSAKRVRQHVTMARAGDVFGRELTGVDEQLRIRAGNRQVE